MIMSDYEPPPYRPPNEAGSVLLRVSRGCPWNRCAFCDMYKRIRFEKRPLGELERDIKAAREIYGSSARELFIGDSNSLSVKELPEVLKIVYSEFPKLERVTSYARASTLKRLGADRLKVIKEAGLTRVHVGLESGDAKTLELMNKGTTPEVMIEGAHEAKMAGLEVSEYVLLGAGGMARWKEHAVETARVLSAIDPDFIRMRTLTIQQGTPLSEMVKSKQFEPVTPLVRLEETLVIVSGLEVTDTELASDHITNYLYVDGRLVYDGVAGHLPEAKNDLVKHISKTLEFLKNTDGEIWDSNYMLERGYIVGL
ncbi:MAG: radical SAM protein [Thermoplasmata archaeon]|nr:MAG: radical SAM protein [Thermoplasmata archaeon]